MKRCFFFQNFPFKGLLQRGTPTVYDHAAADPETFLLSAAFLMLSPAHRGLWRDAAAVKTAADVCLESEQDCIGHLSDFKGVEGASSL